MGVDLVPVPIDEVLDFRRQHFAEHRNYCLSARRFAHELSTMDEAERKVAFDLRQAELEALEETSSLRVDSYGCSYHACGRPSVGRCLTMSATALNFASAQKPAMGAYSYLLERMTAMGIELS